MTKQIIDEKLVNDFVNNCDKPTGEELEQILKKAASLESLSYDEINKLLNVKDEKALNKVYRCAEQIKEQIYGKRIVLFAPLYIANYCTNNCRYCGYQHKNEFTRQKLTSNEIQDNVKALIKKGHKRLALELGEDAINTPIEYVLQSIDDIYAVETPQGNIRRINVNIAATSVENYKKLKEKDIGTYILFQETYDRKAYEFYHESGKKANYEYHLEAFDRAIEAGIDDVGAGALFGLANYKSEVLGLVMHNRYLFDKFKIGFHTISVPRLQKAVGMNLDEYPNLVNDDEFKKIVAVLRIAMPYVGLILSTREETEFRMELIDLGVSQISSESSTDVGGYTSEVKVEQFEVSDKRSAIETIKDLLRRGYLPSFCTACYRMGRTGEAFYDMVMEEKISQVCQPNGLITLAEYAHTFGDEELKELAMNYIEDELEEINDEVIKDKLQDYITRVLNGEKDLFI